MIKTLNPRDTIMFLNFENANKKVMVSTEHQCPYKGQFELIQLQESIRNNLSNGISIESSGGISTEGAVQWLIDLFKKAFEWLTGKGKESSENLEQLTEKYSEVQKQLKDLSDKAGDKDLEVSDSEDRQKIILASGHNFSKVCSDINANIDFLNQAWTLCKKLFDTALKERKITNQGTLLNNHFNSKLNNKVLLPEGFVVNEVTSEIKVSGEVDSYTWDIELKEAEQRLEFETKVKMSDFLKVNQSVGAQLEGISNRLTEMMKKVTEDFDGFIKALEEMGTTQDAANLKSAMSGYNLIKVLLNDMIKETTKTISAHSVICQKCYAELKEV